MVSPAGHFASAEWKKFLLLDEQLLGQPTAADAIQVIENAIRETGAAQVQVWLSQPFYPLPGEPPVPLLPSPDAPALVQEAVQKRAAINGDQACAAFPLISKHNLLGVIHVTAPDGKTLSADICDYFEGLAEHAALALEVNRQAAVKNWRYEQLALVRSVSAQIANVLDVDELCQRVTRLIQKTFDYYYVAIFTVNDQHVTCFRASAGMNGALNNSPEVSVQNGEGLIGQAVLNGGEILASNVDNEPLYRYIDTLPETQSEFTLPLKVENRVVGVLDIQSDQVNAFHEIDRLVLRTLADNIALAIAGAEMYDTLERRADQISAVLDVSHALTSILDPDELLNEVAQVIHRSFGYPYVHLFSVHSGRRKIFYRAGSGERSQAYVEGDAAYDLDAPGGIIPHVARTGKTLLANDVSQEPHYLPSDLPPYNTRSELTIPLVYNEDVLGVLDLQSDETGAFDQNDVSLLEALASTISISLRNATLYRSEAWRRQVAESFRDVAGLLSANVALDKLLDRILVSLENNLPCEASAIWLLDDDPNNENPLQLAAVHGVSTEKIIQTRLSSAEVREWLDYAIYSDGPTIRKINDPHGPLGAALAYPAEYSSIGCPLRAGDKILGVLTLAHPTSGRYGTAAREMITVFANYAAVAIQNARLYTDAKEQSWISTVLLQVAESNQSNITLDELVANTTRQIPMLLGVTRVGVFLWDEDRQMFQLAGASGLDSLEEHSLFPEKEHPAFARLRAGQNTLFIENPAELNLPESVIDPHGGTLVLLPLKARGELQGALLVAHETASPGTSRGFTAQTLSILQGIAHQAAVSIENLRLIEARQEEAYVTAVLLQVAQAVVTVTDLEDVLDTIVHLMPILVGIDACMIYLWDKERKQYVPTTAQSGFKPEERELLERTYPEGGFCLLDQVREHDTFILSPLPEQDMQLTSWPGLSCMPPGSIPSAEMSTAGCWLFGVPLSVKGENYGILLAKETTAGPGFRERRMEIINGIAQEVALAIQNDHLQREMVVRERMEREVQLAREIQRTFLPSRLPQPNGWDLDARWQTARQVGGDFYDIFSLGKDHLGMVIADVADKGMPAALYMTVTRTLIRASVHHVKSPARVLERVNNLLVPDAQNGMFVTAFFAMLDLQSGELVFANAGHNRPFVQRQNGLIEQLPKGGMALGVLDNTPLEDQVIHLQPGDCLVLFTDGVTDTFSSLGEAFSEDRLRPVIVAEAGQSAVRMLDAIDLALEEFRGSEPLGDDVTLLAVRRQP